MLKTFNVFLIIFIGIISLSIGYSYFSSQLNIIGNATLENQGNLDLPTEKSNNELSVEIGAKWTNGNLHYYNMNLILTNKDEDVKGWVVTMDLPPKVDIANSQFWCAAEVTVERVGDYDRLTFKNYDWNADILVGGQINFGFNIALIDDSPIEVKNVVFNNKLMEKITYKNTVT